MGGNHLGAGDPVLGDKGQATLTREAVLDHDAAALPQGVLGVRARRRVVQRAVDQLDGVGPVAPERGDGRTGGLGRGHRGRAVDGLGSTGGARGVPQHGGWGVEEVTPGRGGGGRGESRRIDVEPGDTFGAEANRPLGAADLHLRIGDDVLHLVGGKAR